MDRIVARDLVVFANHGVFPEEKTLGQKFLIDIDLGLDCQEAAIKEDLTKSVHYGDLAHGVKKVFTDKSHDLIESASEEVAQYILRTYPLVNEVRLRVKKPWAPVGLDLDTVYIEIKRKRHRALLSLGSNMGDKKSNLDKAISLIEDDYTKIKKKSSYYETKAWGKEDQDDFLNAGIEIMTTYTPHTLLDHLQKIENTMGRVRKEARGPRNIDIDIILIDDLVINTQRLSLPHPYMRERAFVLEPLNEIAPKFIDPISHKTIEQLLRDLKNS